jgi:hypothetical protein
MTILWVIAWFTESGWFWAILIIFPIFSIIALLGNGKKFNSDDIWWVWIFIIFWLVFGITFLAEWVISLGSIIIFLYILAILGGLAYIFIPKIPSSVIIIIIIPLWWIITSWIGWIVETLQIKNQINSVITKTGSLIYTGTVNLKAFTGNVNSGNTLSVSWSRNLTNPLEEYDAYLEQFSLWNCTSDIQMSDSERNILGEFQKKYGDDCYSFSGYIMTEKTMWFYLTNELFVKNEKDKLLSGKVIIRWLKQPLEINSMWNSCYIARWIDWNFSVDLIQECRKIIKYDRDSMERMFLEKVKEAWYTTVLITPWSFGPDFYSRQWKRYSFSYMGGDSIEFNEYYSDNIILDYSGWVNPIFTPRALSANYLLDPSKYPPDKNCFYLVPSLNQKIFWNCTLFEKETGIQIPLSQYSY